MQKIVTIIAVLISQVLIAWPICYAAEPAIAVLAPANTLTPNLTSALTELRKKVQIAVIFPQKIPQDSEINPYYADIDLPPSPIAYDYIINIDATPDCHGIRQCNLGYLRAKRGGKPEMLQDSQHKIITVPITLANQQQAWFTPGHTLGSFFPALLEWQQNGVLYSLSWNVMQQQEQATLIAMANSATQQ